MAAYAALVFVLSVMPTGPSVAPPHLDKLIHLCKYLLFAWLLMRAIRATRMTEPEYGLWAWIYATSYGLLMEMVQAMIPWRSADWLDAAANAVGAALGVWLGRIR